MRILTVGFTDEYVKELEKELDKYFICIVDNAKDMYDATNFTDFRHYELVIIVVEGVGYYQDKGKETIIINKGEVVNCKKDTEHWHTASAKSSVSYIAIYGKQPTIWTEKLTQNYYDSVALKLEGE